MDNLVSLKKLNLTGSKIESLTEFPTFPNLEQLILDGNSVATIAELPKLAHLTKTEEIVNDWYATSRRERRRS